MSLRRLLRVRCHIGNISPRRIRNVEANSSRVLLNGLTKGSDMSDCDCDHKIVSVVRVSLLVLSKAFPHHLKDLEATFSQ